MPTAPPLSGSQHDIYEVEFFLTTDNWSDPRAVERFKSAFGLPLADHAPGLHWFSETFKRRRRQLRESSNRSPTRRRVLQAMTTAPGLGQFLQPGRKVWRLACYRALLRLADPKQLADHHKPSGNANAGLEVIAVQPSIRKRHR